MNPLPFLGLAVVAGGFAVAIEALDLDFARSEMTPIRPFSTNTSTSLSVEEDFLADTVPVDIPHCEPAQTLAATLAEDFAEEPVEVRMAGDGLTVELWASSIMGTWTIVHHGFDGISCVIGSGVGWNTESGPDDVFAQVALAS